MNAKAAEEDPLAQLGYGITAYINILFTFIWVFVLFSLLLIPTMQAFSSGDVINTFHENAQSLEKILQVIPATNPNGDGSVHRTKVDMSTQGVYRVSGIDVDTKTLTQTHVPDGQNLYVWHHLGSI